ncbi:MAG: DMT family transporter [Gammaproteobacteria bacterium]|nr:DMT family transporter [Gammaproteobacteria bacterium]
MKNSESQAIGLGLAAVLCWSTVATAFKIALAYQSVSALVFLASLTSVVFLGLVLAMQGKLNQAIFSLRRHWRRALLFGFLNPLLYYHILLWAYEILPAQVAQPINYTWAIMLALLAVPFLGHKLSKFDLMALLICYSGVVVISLGAGAGGQATTTRGVALALISTVIWAAYWILNSRDHREPIEALFQNFLVVLPVAGLFAGPLNLSWPALLSSAYIGIFEMGISFVCWLYAMRRTRNASRISNLIFLAPFISLMLIHFVLGETIHSFTFYGLALIIAGLVIQNRAAKPPTVVSLESTRD